ncbi:patatin-like phospholipase family protein [Millisia brevis]|uniref:patatin-like phospholipase family protein n=1 Tax=Millisia brevis TaxID=264148 RepID=UPI0008313EDF|nr:patatin-like phospholipase family protein [Millisia brevis]
MPTFSTSDAPSAAPADRNHPQIDAANRLPGSGERALVLGGGGAAGNAWLIGVIAGLLDGGLDVTDADLIIGTSAGSTAAAQITTADPARLYADIVGAPAGPGAAAPVGGGRGTAGTVADLLDRTGRVIAEAADLPQMRRTMGAMLAAASAPGGTARWRATVANRLPRPEWPDRTVLITAVDTDTGAPILFDRASGIDLVDAVAAGCAGGFAYEIGDHRYIDGGYRTNADNADLAAGYERVLVLSPFGGRARTPVEWGTHLADQIDRLRRAGSRVETMFPDTAARKAFGESMMDLSTRAPAATAGFAHGLRLAGPLANLWR